MRSSKLLGSNRASNPLKHTTLSEKTALFSSERQGSFYLTITEKTCLLKQAMPDESQHPECWRVERLLIFWRQVSESQPKFPLKTVKKLIDRHLKKISNACPSGPMEDVCEKSSKRLWNNCRFKVPNSSSVVTISYILSPLVSRIEKFLTTKKKLARCFLHIVGPFISKREVNKIFSRHRRSLYTC